MHLALFKRWIVIGILLQNVWSCKNTNDTSLTNENRSDKEGAVNARALVENLDTVLDEKYRTFQLHEAIPPFNCKVLENFIGGRQYIRSCAIKNAHSNEFSCVPGTHSSVWKITQTMKPSVYDPKVDYINAPQLEVYEHQPAAIVVPLDIEDRQYWLSFSVKQMPERKGTGAERFLCAPDSVVAKTQTWQNVAQGTALKALSSQKLHAADLGEALALSFPLGVGTIYSVHLCREGEYSCWDASISGVLDLADLIVPVGKGLTALAKAGKLTSKLAKAEKTGRQIAKVVNVVGGSARVGQAIYEGSQGNGWNAVFFGAEGMMSLATAGVLSIKKVRNNIDDFDTRNGVRPQPEPNARPRIPCMGLTSSGCNLRDLSHDAAKDLFASRPGKIDLIVDDLSDVANEALRKVKPDQAERLNFMVDHMSDSFVPQDMAYAQWRQLSPDTRVKYFNIDFENKLREKISQQFVQEFDDEIKLPGAGQGIFVKNKLKDWLESGKSNERLKNALVSSLDEMFYYSSIEKAQWRSLVAEFFDNSYVGRRVTGP